MLQGEIKEVAACQNDARWLPSRASCSHHAFLSLLCNMLLCISTEAQELISYVPVHAAYERAKFPLAALGDAG